LASRTIDASVIVATYNQLESTTTALRALFAQKTVFSYEVIVCDDGSDSQTAARLRQVLASSPVPAYLVVQQDRGFRLAASRNNGIRMSRGNVLVFLDGDLMPEEDFIENHVRAHDGERVVAAGKRLFRVPELVPGDNAEDIRDLWELLRTEQAVNRSSRAQEGFELLFRHYAWKDQPWMTCFGCNISVRKSPLIQFDEAFQGWGNEDWDLFYGLVNVHGYKVLPVDAVAYDISGAFNYRDTWSQRHFIEHLITGFQFYDKWSQTGLKIEHAIPRHELDPRTGRWSFSRRRLVGKLDEDFPAYVDMARGWLVARGLYPDKQSASPVAD
jgi:glycosyltransferase involved in cell wall biosynthesis